MPPRVARSNTASAATTAKPTRKKVQKSQKRALNAFTAAQHVVEDKAKFRKHRTGELDTTQERGGPKRRRADSDEEGDEDDDEEEGRGAKRTKGDDSDHGSDSSGNEWRLGGEIGEDSDSDLDSDEAFGESDEERFEGFTFRGSSGQEPGQKKKSKSSKKSRAPVGSDEDADAMDLNEDDDDDSGADSDPSSLGEDGVDLATMLDQPLSSEDEDSGTEGDGEDESDSASATSVSSHGSSSAAKISKLQDLVASLESGGPSSSAKGSRAVSGPDAHEALAPSDYALTSRQKLALTDLLPTITDPALRKSLKTLTGTTAKSSSSSSTRAAAPLTAPLPVRHQAKLDRAAATAKAKEELDRWQDTVIQNRRAEHLSFPLADPTKSAPAGEDQLVGVGEDRGPPANELEGAIRSILEQSGLSTSAGRDAEEARIAAGEELALKEVPVEQVLARRAALRQARDLLFREERRAKRISKIKSKSYRRVHRREKEREEGRRREIMGPDGDEEEEEEGRREKSDRLRAMERMGGRHKESKWAKGMRKAGRTVWDEDAREGVVDMARRNEELRRRMEGKEGSDESESEEEAESDEGSEGERERVGRQIGRLDKEDKEERKGIAGMAFMRKAEAARKAQNDELVREMKRDLGGETEDAEFDEAATIGRKVFGPKADVAPQRKTKVVKGMFEEPESGGDEQEEENAEIITERPGQDANKVNASRPLPSGSKKQAKHIDTTSTDDIDAWMTAKTSDRKDKKKKASVQEYIPAPAAAIVPAKATSIKSKTKQKQPLAESASSSAPDTTNWPTVPGTVNGGHDDSDSSAADSDVEANPILTKTQEQEMFHARAFAGDDVALAFDTEKDALALSEDEKETSNHLPGWGSWAGSGLSKAARKANARHKHNPLFKSKVDGVRQADRRDAKLHNVIISERQERKGKKYLATQLPHQFERRDQYERSLRAPLGPEWSTKESFQRNTKPRVVVKQGIVEPIARPLV